MGRVSSRTYRLLKSMLHIHRLIPTQHRLLSYSINHQAKIIKDHPKIIRKNDSKLNAEVKKNHQAKIIRENDPKLNTEVKKTVVNLDKKETKKEVSNAEAKKDSKIVKMKLPISD